MIVYKADKWGIVFAFSLKGSVFPKSFGFALGCAAITVALHYFFSLMNWKDDVRVGDKGTSVLGMFTFVLGFLLVFRTQQAYSRWWEGGTLLQELRGEWFNAYSCLLAFANPAPEKKHDVSKFQHELARLVSMLYGAGLAQVCSLDKKTFEVIDLEDFDIESLIFVDQAHDACEVVLQWVQRLIGKANAEETIKVAPPILSRVYNQLGNGIVKLNNARKITNFPIPFPFAQMITAMLMVHWIAAVIICSTSIESPVWAGMLSFAVILSFWSINFIALELEDPFGEDANDLPMKDLQTDLNLSLKELLHPQAMQVPVFTYHEKYHSYMVRQTVNFKDLHDSIREVYNTRRSDIFELAETERDNLYWLPELERDHQAKLKKMHRDADTMKKSMSSQNVTGSQTGGFASVGIVPVAVKIPPDVPAVASTVKAAPMPPPAVTAAKASAPAPVQTMIVGNNHDRSAIDAEHIKLSTQIERHLSRAVGELTKAVSELQHIADQQNAQYQLHCDFWGLLSTVFAKPATPSLSPSKSSYPAPFLQEVVPTAIQTPPTASQTPHCPPHCREDDRANLI